jgi:uncharacterized membrane protein YeaQ/YmgE (transglycosylase-associated protein family)
MSMILFLVSGFAVGLVARALTPGDHSMGVVMTVGLAVAGSFAGGSFASLIADSPVADLNPSIIAGSIIGALVALFIVGAATTYEPNV